VSGPVHPRSLAPGAALVAGGQVVLTASSALAAVAVARLLGPEGVGAFAVAGAFLLLLTTVATLGLESGIAYRVSGGSWAPRRAWAETQRAALLLGVAGAGAGIGATLLAPGAFRGLSPGLVVATAAALPFALSWLYASTVALAADRYEAAAVPTVVQAVTSLVAVASLAAAFGVAGAVAGLALAHVAAAAAAALRARGLVRGASGARELRAAGRFGLRTYGANVLQFLNYRLDLFVLNAVAAPAAVGRYSIAVAVTSLVWLLPRGLSAVLLPRVAALSAGDDDARTSRADVEAKSVRHAVVLAAASAVALTGGLALVPAVYGAEFAPAIGLGLILLPGAALLGVANVLMAIVVGRGRPGLSLAGALVATPVTVGLYLALIPPLGATGAALASTLSYALSFVLSLVFFRRVTGARLAVLVPTRDEAADYRRLRRAAASARAARRAGAGPTPPNAGRGTGEAAPPPRVAEAAGRPGSRG
jgi:O-antigen/teichoic acid export membrane protein